MRRGDPLLQNFLLPAVGPALAQAAYRWGLHSTELWAVTRLTLPAEIAAHVRRVWDHQKGLSPLAVLLDVRVEVYDMWGGVALELVWIGDNIPTELRTNWEQLYERVMERQGSVIGVGLPAWFDWAGLPP